ncbi:hypothetical protein CONCODRAFT_126415 [Conidiobolus coronatus NRRL 28638]|uniref:Sec7/BIG1-like C-terminal domain-containing protein n=1 Tax=Conidiobolus coronatus (strain ATCC 28846 / CBS 209.66 / NRRL 28638) TaxID=796925 RepID=A0A137NVD6_CONC2|nr:hypothetical protein CONCODRAFT_126415 [Conidiobolus coronatus NRRL 28638]|eukprot:KXN66584.1 hypothetical protein CONCODRAFT_126415 [Conidiobolus coronatus NRRL 28638]
MKMFGDVNAQSKQHGIHSFSKEELDMWVSTTLVEALRRFVALFTDYFDSLFPFIDGLLDLLAACLCQEDTTLSKLGASCFQQLVENNVHKLNHEHWEKLISIVIRLFNASRLDIPVPQSDLTLSLTGCNADDISDLERRIIDDSIPIPLSPKNDQHRQSLCLLMLSLIEDLFLQHDLVFDNVDPNYLFIILSGVESTYHQTQIVNGKFDLKDAVNRDALYEITKFAKTSLNQELSCISSLMKILLRMYDSDNEIYKRFHNKVEERLIPLFKDTFKEFNQISNYPLTKATQQVYDVWHNVVLRVGNFLCKAKDSNFKIIFGPISEEAILTLKHRHLTDDIKDMLFNLMMRIRTIYIVSDSTVNLHEDPKSEEEVQNSSSDEDNQPLSLVNGGIQKSQQFKQVELERASSVKSLPRSVYEEID